MGNFPPALRKGESEHLYIIKEKGAAVCGVSPWGSRFFLRLLLILVLAEVLLCAAMFSVS